MSEVVRATFGGFPLLLSKEVSWSLKEGVTPHIQTFHMQPKDAESLQRVKANIPFTLHMEDDSGHVLDVEKLFLLDVQPGPHPYISEVTVADRRWMWPNAHVLRRYNVRRAVGTKRVLNNASFAVPFDKAPEVQYWRWSLFSYRTSNQLIPWTTTNIMKDVIKAVGEVEDAFKSGPLNVKIDTDIVGKLKSLPIEDFILDDTGEAAVSRLLQKIPGVGVYVDYNGEVVFYNKTTGREEEIVKALLPEMRDMGHTDLVLKNRLRPQYIDYYFTMDVEVRFDYEEVTKARLTTSENQSNPLANRRELENVLSITDYDLDVPEIDTQFPQCQGTWITIDQAFRAWDPISGGFLAGNVEVDHELVQQAFVPHNDLWTFLGLAGATPDNSGTLKPWTGRIAEIMTRYRQTFRINPWWMDRILAVRANRVATINPQSGQRAPARAWSDYCVIYSQRSLMRNRSQNQNPRYVINRAAFPDGGNFDSDAEVSPAILQVVDHDQGIIHLNYVGTNPKSGDTHMILPSQMEVEGSPAYGLADARRDKSVNISFDSVRKSSDLPKLSNAFKMSTILTVVPASPNSKQQLYRLRVKPGDVSKYFKNGLGGCDGPPMQVRIGPNIETARIQWKDSRSSDIEKIFGLDNGNPTDQEPNLENLVVNSGDVEGVRFGASLRNLAESHATTVWMSLVDRYEGNITSHFQGGGVHLAGYANEIKHTLHPNGVATTSSSFPTEVPRLNLAQFLDSNSRNAIFKLVAVEK